MQAFLASLEFWHWAVLGLILVIFEVFAPGVFFLWLGLGAFLTGTVMMVFPSMGWELQLVLFAVFGVTAVIVGRRFYDPSKAEPTDHPHLSERDSAQIGKVFTLIKPMTDGVGKIKFGDSEWRVTGNGDLPKGAKVRVTGLEGASFAVEPVEEPTDA